jgi:hypothetical protein
MEYQATFWMFFAIASYFLPWIEAYRRGHSKIEAIAVLNLLLGWTSLVG